MKNLISYLSESVNSSQNLQPKNKRELENLIRQEINKNSPKCDLNHIDVSKIDDMSYLFSSTSGFSRFNGDISGWDVSNVKDMEYMFEDSNFNGDISKWDVSNVKNMHGMFYKSKFNGDISSWDVSKVKSMDGMFMFSLFNQDISKWNVSNVLNFKDMFYGAEKFNQNLSNWKINPESKSRGIFRNCPIKDNFKPKGVNQY